MNMVNMAVMARMAAMGLPPIWSMRTLRAVVQALLSMLRWCVDSRGLQPSLRPGSSQTALWWAVAGCDTGACGSSWRSSHAVVQSPLTGMSRRERIPHSELRTST